MSLPATPPGCTKQACGIRDAWGEFERTGATLLGVSPDKVAKVLRRVKPDQHADQVLAALAG